MKVQNRPVAPLLPRVLLERFPWQDSAIWPVQGMGGRGISRHAVVSQAAPLVEKAPLFAYERRKLPKLVAETLLQTIVDGGWREGSPLGTEQELLAHYRISRATLREAIRDLERSGAVVMRRGQGLVVTTPSRDAIIEMLSGYLKSGSRASRGSAAVRAMLDDCRESPLTDLLRDVLSASKPSTSTAPAPRLKLAAETATAIASQLESYSSGERIGTEAEWIQRCGVSRATLREALVLLENQGLLTRKRGLGGGLFKNEPDSRAVADMAATFLHYLHPTADAIDDARRALETNAAAAAAQRATAAQVDWLGEMLIPDQIKTDVSELERHREFHTRIAAITGNRALALFIEILMRSFYTVRISPSAEFLHGLKASHRHIYAAIAHADANAARAAMIDHLEFSSRWMRAGLLSV